MKSSGASFEIVPLADMAAAVDTLVVWFEAEWAPYYGAGGPGDAKTDLTESCRSAGLPIAFVACSADGEVAGTAALKRDSMASHRHLTPWLAAMVVAPAWRGGGVGTALAQAVMAEAGRQGFAEVFCGVDGGTTLLPRLGWQPIGSGPTLRGEAVILRRVV